MKGNLFSDSWFKVARLRVSLHGAVEIQKQVYRGDTWYVVRSSFGSDYFKITPEAYDFVATLTTDLTIEEHWERFLGQYGGAAPTQNEVIQVLTELYSHNLLYFKNVPHAGHIFERKSEKKRKERLTTLLSLISIKIPLWNPDSLLAAMTPLYKYIFSYYAFVVWLLAIFAGGKAAVSDLSLIADASQGMLAPGNLVFLYASLVIMKLGHECAHAVATKHFGGSVRTVGVMFLVLTPLPYMDASDSWFFQERRQRLLVSAAGMLFDVFAAAVAAVVWAETGDGIVHSVAFNVMILGSISSIFFNGNPLIRFDAYYILADMLEIPNLYERARQFWFYLFERYLFSVKLNDMPTGDSREAFWLALYGATSFVYRCLLSVTILMLIADKLLMLGILLFIITIIVGGILPARRFAIYLSSSQNLAGVRGRAVAVSLFVLLLAIVACGIIPLPRTISAPGVVELSGHKKIYASTEGRLEQVFPKNGDAVEMGQIIAELSNFDLDRDIDVTISRLAQAMAMKQKAHNESTADLKPLIERVALLEEQLSDFHQRKTGLHVVAESSGTFVSPNIESYKGKWLKRQTLLGALVSEGEVRLSAIVSQEQAFELFRINHYNGVARLFGSAGHALPLSDVKVNPYQKEELPSAALGWFGGGEVAVSSSDRSGKKTTESFYEVAGKLSSENVASSLKLLHGRAGLLRLSLPPEPLATKVYRKIRQTLQKRYKI